ncbi:MAG: F-type H+-transporting ATPase subunit a [Candidatus Binatota bacterium]|nr:F-type H+-transporting ATPase subunit a [Candidatus Binatota bacterium]
MNQHGFTWVQAIPGLSALPANTATALLIAALLLFLARSARHRLDTDPTPLVPDGRLTARDFFEVITGWLADLAEGMIGHGARRYVPFFATIFLFILFANLIGLVPGFTPPTDSFHTTFALGVVSFFVYNYYGFQEHGAKYLKHFMGPVVWLAPLMIVVELFSHAFRPISLAIRLFGNMFADHLVLGIFTDLTKLVAPVAFYMLGALVCVVQAFVFTVLSMVYVALAVSHDH